MTRREVRAIIMFSIERNPSWWPESVSLTPMAPELRARLCWSVHYGRRISADELFEIRFNLKRFAKLLLRLEHRNRLNEVRGHA